MTTWERQQLIELRSGIVQRNLALADEKFAEVDKLITNGLQLPWWAHFRRRRALRRSRRILSESEALLDVNIRMQARNARDLAAISAELGGAS